MEAIRLETTINHDGRINVPGVHVGDAVEVIVLLRSPRTRSYPLRGTQCSYPNPFDPAIPESDWEPGT
jgi:hypothetical protein